MSWEQAIRRKCERSPALGYAIGMSGYSEVPIKVWTDSDVAVIAVREEVHG